MGEIVYIQMKQKVHLELKKYIVLEDVAQIVTNFAQEQALLKIPVYHLTHNDKKVLVIEAFQVIKQLKRDFKQVDFELIGNDETIVNVQQKRKKRSFLIIAFVWILLFFGTAMTIINFHYDVSMQEVQQRIHYLFTGKDVARPLFIQIPYSIGLGVGMVVFLNHWFKKKINDEPSPLEIELFNYERNLDKYVIYNENESDEPH